MAPEAGQGSEYWLKQWTDLLVRREIERPDRFWLPFRLMSDAPRMALRYGERTPSDIIYRENKMRVLRYRPQGDLRCPTPLVMTAPLVMPHYIMDLKPGKSLVAYLVSRGLDVFMIDWGTPDAGDRYDTLDDYVARYLRHAVEAVCSLTQQVQVSLHGYCQGGLLAVLFAALYPDRVRNLVNQTGPVNFHDEGIFSLWARELDVDLIVDTLGNMPAEVLWASFQTINPTGALGQMLHFYDGIENDRTVDDYIAMNTWLNHVIAMPGEFFRRFIRDLYQHNLLVKGELEIAGRRIDLSRITCPVLTITSERDHVVPWQSSAVLNDLVSSADKRLFLMRGGHLGMTIGRGAWNEMWPAFAEWIIQRSQTERRAYA